MITVFFVKSKLINEKKKTSIFMLLKITVLTVLSHSEETLI